MNRLLRTTSGRVWMIFIGLLIAGAVFRLVGSEWGFPLLAEADEPLITIDTSRAAIHGEWALEHYDHPGCFSIDTNVLLYRAYFLLSGHPRTQEYYDVHVHDFYRLSRLLCAWWSTALIAVAFLLGREFSERQALVAAAAVAFFPSFVEHAHYITPDIPLTLWIGLCALGCVRHLRTGRMRDIVFASVAGAVALAEKYPGALTVLMIAAAVWSREEEPLDRRLRRLVWAAAVYLAAAFAVAPWLFLRFDRVLTALAVEARPGHIGADGLGFAGNLQFYFEQFAARAGWLAMALGVPGLVAIVNQGGRRSLPVFFGILYLTFLSTLGLHWERWALPADFFFLQVIAAGVVWGWDSIQPRMRLARGLAAMVVLLIFASMTLQSLLQTVIFGLPDTRIVALRFCARRGITSHNTAYENYTPFATTLHLPEYLPRRSHFIRIAPGPGGLLQSGRRHVIISSLVYECYFAQPERYERAIGAYAEIRRRHRVARFESQALVGFNTYRMSPFSPTAVVDTVWQLVRACHPNAYSGPTLEIYDVHQGSGIRHNRATPAPDRGGRGGRS